MTSDSPLVSVVVPTYNRRHIIRNTLLSLGRQSYPSTRYQVVLVDDGSTDGTIEYVKSLQMDNLTVISNAHQGAAAARNAGFRAADGDVIIFCDSDMVVPSGFVEQHVKRQSGRDLLALSGLGHWRHLVSYDFKDSWLESQKAELSPFFEQPFIQERLLTSEDGHLIYEEEILEERLEPFIYRIPSQIQWVNSFEEIIAVYGRSLNGFRFPWVTFCTGNVSIRKQYLHDLGGFDEQLSEHEDWELGYRFYLAGGRFRFSTSVESLQQYTPPSHPERLQKAEHSYEYLLRKHPSVDMYLTILIKNGSVSFPQVSNVLDQYNRIKRDFPNSSIRHQFKKMIRLYAQGMNPPLKPRVHPTVGWGRILNVRENIKSTGQYDDFIGTFDFLLHGKQ